MSIRVTSDELVKDDIIDQRLQVFGACEILSTTNSRIKFKSKTSDWKIIMPWSVRLTASAHQSWRISLFLWLSASSTFGIKSRWQNRMNLCAEKSGSKRDISVMISDTSVLPKTPPCNNETLVDNCCLVTNTKTVDCVQWQTCKIC